MLVWHGDDEYNPTWIADRHRRNLRWVHWESLLFFSSLFNIQDWGAPVGIPELVACVYFHVTCFFFPLSCFGNMALAWDCGHHHGEVEFRAQRNGILLCVFWLLPAVLIFYFLLSVFLWELDFLPAITFHSQLFFLLFNFVILEVSETCSSLPLEPILNWVRFNSCVWAGTLCW